MSILKNPAADQNASADDTSMLTPEEVIRQLRAIRERIPEFVQLSATERRKVKRIATVDPEIAHLAISAASSSELVQSAIGNTPDDLHQSERETVRWSAVENELRAMLRGVADGNLARQHRFGLAVLQIYNVSRQLARHPDHAHLLPFVERMARRRKLVRRPSRTGEGVGAEEETPDTPSS